MQLAVTTRTGQTPLGPYVARWREQVGEGPTILLLHGIYAGASSYEWRRLVPALEGRTVRSPDLLGSARSDRPDLEWRPSVLTWVVDALIRDAAADAGPPVVVASSLTGAHALRAVATGAPAARLVLITPTGLGDAQTTTSGALGRFAYALGRHTPLGDLVIRGLSSEPSVRWFQEHQTYADPDNLTDEEVHETRRAARLPNAKHLQLAFVANRLGLRVDPAEVEAVGPTVIWGSGQGFVEPLEERRWMEAGADVTVLRDGLPQVESPEVVASLVRADGQWGSTALTPAPGAGGAASDRRG